jgi:hypothetical protein
VAERAAPTAEQHAAITASGSAAVSAGAGCGKTMVLAERFVHLLRPGPDGSAPVSEVSQILAVTFTEKAAGEMKRRIRALVAEEIICASDAQRPHWERVRRELLGAQVSTIHALCARILRDNPLEAGIDPHAAVLDEYESRDYLERVIESELLLRLRAGDPAVQSLLARTRGLHGGRGRGAVRTMARLLEAASRLGREGDWLVRATEDATDPALLAPPLADAIRALIDGIETWIAMPKAPAAAREVAAEWPRGGSSSRRCAMRRSPTRSWHCCRSRRGSAGGPS